MAQGKQKHNGQHPCYISFTLHHFCFVESVTWQQLLAIIQSSIFVWIQIQSGNQNILNSCLGQVVKETWLRTKIQGCVFRSPAMPAIFQPLDCKKVSKVTSVRVAVIWDVTMTGLLPEFILHNIIIRQTATFKNAWT